MENEKRHAATPRPLRADMIEGWKREGATGVSMRKYIFAHEWEQLCDLAIAGLAAQSETATPDATCSRCNGAGAIPVTQGQGEDCEVVDASCPDCDGTGAVHAPRSAGAPLVSEEITKAPLTTAALSSRPLPDQDWERMAKELDHIGNVMWTHRYATLSGQANSIAAALRRATPSATAPMVHAAWRYRDKINGTEVLTHQPPDRLNDLDRYEATELFAVDPMHAVDRTGAGT